MGSRRSSVTWTEPAWVRVCPAHDLMPGVGASALARGKRVAIFRLDDGSVYAVSNRDPFSGTPSISRGLVGMRASGPVVAAPRGRQVFDLATGRCADDPGVQLQTYPVRITDGYVEVRVLVRGAA